MCKILPNKIQIKIIIIKWAIIQPKRLPIYNIDRFLEGM